VGTFEAAYTSIAKGASDPELGGNVHARFLEQAPKLYDAHVTAWLLKQVAAADPGDKDAVAPAGLRAAILLMAPHEAPAVAAAVKKYGAPEQAELAKAATVVTDKCATTLDCYVGVLDETAGGGTAGVAALKAGMMLGMFGNDQIRGELVKRVERLKDREVREAVLFAILRLAPNGDKPAAGVLEKLAKSEQGKSPEETQLLTRVAMILKTRI
jgi:hypothetical protein